MNETVFINDVIGNKMLGMQHFPDKVLAQSFVDDIFRFLFIGRLSDWDNEVA